MDALWRTTMAAVVENPNVLDVSDIEGAVRGEDGSRVAVDPRALMHDTVARRLSQVGRSDAGAPYDPVGKDVWSDTEPSLASLAWWFSPPWAHNYFVPRFTATRYTPSCPVPPRRFVMGSSRSE